ncbi:MAG TPA: GntR family transcriptional regulator [Anaerolineaceae bacterium]|nr:GntR family transcriptional regulator [Anaerolineaceae bacterium]
MFPEIDNIPLKGVPRYVQIREDIRRKIEKREIKVGTQLPSEADLAEMFGVSRMTVRRAIEDLVMDGLLIRKQGTGTIVSSRKVVRDYTKLTSFHEDAQSRGMHPISRVLKFEVILPPADYVEKLMIKETDKVFHIIRLRMVDDNQIIALHETFIPQPLCPWIENANLENESLYELYKKHGLAIEWGKQIVEARSVTEEQAQCLQISMGSPVLFSERISYTVNNVPVEVVAGVCPGDRFSINLILRR